MLACQMQLIEDERASFLDNMYFVFHSCKFLIVQPDPLRLGKAVVKYQREYSRLVQNVPDKLYNAVNLTDQILNFRAHRGAHSLVGLEGFDVVNHITLCRIRLVFNRPNAYIRVHDFINETIQKLQTECKTKLAEFIESNAPKQSSNA
jgi:hypothetical protein